VVVLRDDREEVLYLDPIEDYDNDRRVEGRQVYDDDLRYFGVVLEDRYPDRIVIRSVLPGTPAYIAGIRAGDEITTWHGQRVTSPRDFAGIVRRVEPGTVDFEYSRDAKSIRGEAKFERRADNRPRGPMLVTTPLRATQRLAATNALVGDSAIGKLG